MLLLAERYDLPVIKMVSFGVLVDRLISVEEPSEEMSDIREELMQIAEQITYVHKLSHNSKICIFQDNR